MRLARPSRLCTFTQKHKSKKIVSLLSTLLSQSTDTISQFAESVRTQAGPISQDIVTRLAQESERLKARVDADLTVLGSQMQPYAEEVVAEVRRKVEELKREAEPYTGPVDTESLIQRSNELKEQLDRRIEQLQAEMIPFAEEMKERVQQGVNELLRTQVNMDTQELQGRLTQLGEELKAKMTTDTKILRRQLKDLWKSFMVMTQ